MNKYLLNAKKAHKGQLKAYKFAAKHSKASALFADPGFGKSMVVVARVGKLIEEKGISRILIVCPKSVLYSWLTEFVKWAKYPIIPVIVEGPGPSRKKAILEARSHAHPVVYIISYETLRICRDQILKSDFHFVVLDESHRIARHTSQQSKAAHKVGDKAPYKMILTGTPVTERPDQIFSQYRFLDKTIFGDKWTTFKQLFVVTGNPFIPQQITGYRNLEVLKAQMAKRAFFGKKPRGTKVDHISVPVLMNPTEKGYYERLKKDLFLELKGGEVDASHILAQVMKLLQITGGSVKDSNGQVHEWPNPSKLEALADLIEDFGDDKYVIFCRFIAEIKAVSALLSRRKISHETFYGKTENREEIIHSFQNHLDPQVLVIQTSTGGVGITLTAANRAVFYSRSYSLTEYLQAVARVDRISQERDVTIYDLYSKSTLDETITKLLGQKKKVADYLTNPKSMLESLK